MKTGQPRVQIRELYYANGYGNDEQQVDFLSFREYLESIHIPDGKEITPRVFASWAARQRLPKPCMRMPICGP